MQAQQAGQPIEKLLSGSEDNSTRNLIKVSIKRNKILTGKKGRWSKTCKIPTIFHVNQDQYAPITSRIPLMFLCLFAFKAAQHITLLSRDYIIIDLSSQNLVHATKNK
jgi:hypothetical protein